MHSLARTLLAATALTVASTVSAQIQPLILDWASATQWNGSSFNATTVHATGSSPVTTIYSWANGLTATVTATLVSGTWQDVSVFGGTAPRYYPTGDVLALGVAGNNAIGSITISFSAPVQLSTLTLGDIDNASQSDQVTLTAYNSGTNSYALLGSLPAAGNLAPTVSTSSTSTILTAVAGADESVFGASASSAWRTVTGGNAFLTDLTITLGDVSATGNGGHGIWLSDLGIGLSPIPEPSTYALLFGAATLAIVGLRRYRKGAN